MEPSLGIDLKAKLLSLSGLPPPTHRTTPHHTTPLQVIGNVVHVTSAGVVAAWWFGRDSTSTVSSSLGRATGPSFGSICLGR
jgi:hypothetical protein